MGLVATSKLRKCKKEVLANSEYAKAARESVEALAGMMDINEDASYFKGNSSNKALYIVIASDSGLCGGYNNNAVTYLNSIIEKSEKEAAVIAVGSKAISYLERFGIKTIAEYVDIPDIPTSKEIKLVYENALKLYDNKEVSEVNVVFTKFISPIKQEVEVEKLLPVESISGAESNQFIEPDFNTVLKSSMDIYLKGKLRSMILTSKCSEQSSRMTAMDGASRNADDIISALNLKFNRIRQTMITNEISEIVSGAQAQK